MTVGFFEVRLSSLLRFPLWLHPLLVAKAPSIRVVYFYDEEDCSVCDVEARLPQDAQLIQVGAVSGKSVVEMLRTFDLDRLVVLAQRIPDTCFVVAARTLGIPTIMYQHGLYIPFMKREGSLFVRNIRKAQRYVRYAMSVADLIDVGRCRLVYIYIRLFIYGDNPQKFKLPLDLINTDRVLVYGEHWKDYHSEQFGYRPEQQVVVGSPDFTDLHGFLADNRREVGVCYIAQTLVEDGRLERRTMLSFITNLSSAITDAGLPLKVKLHPRSDRKLYDALPPETIFVDDELPKTTVYVGHYSSLISKTVFVSNHIILVDFPGHTIPEYLTQVASSTCPFQDADRLSKVIQSCVVKDVDPRVVANNIHEQDFYFDSKIDRPLECAAEAIIDL